MRVLIADDGGVERSIAQQSVELLGHDCLVAEDGERAWALFQAHGADVILTDWLMPGLDGPELCRRVRAGGGPYYTYVILWTVLKGREHTLAGMRAGADDYLAKPLDIDALEASLTAAERITQLYRQLAHRQIRQTTTVEQLASVGSEQAASSGRPHHNLTPQPTALIGRDDDLSRVQALVLRTEVRLVTLTGPPGVGKTRLALAAAAGVAEAFEGGVVFVDLAPVQDAAAVLPTIAEAAGVNEQPTFEALQRALNRERLLLLLDNFEQVALAADQVSRLLAGCPLLTILVTSRSPLRLAWEHEVPLRPLALPDMSSVTDVDSLARAPAVALFAERARAVQPGFALNEHTAGAVATICVYLDGLPLAIELAAARSGVLPLSVLSSRMQHSLELLIGGARDVSERHQTLRGAIAWSHLRLGDQTQRVFRRLAVFAGGMTLEAVAAVVDRPTLAEQQPQQPRRSTREEIETLADSGLLERAVETNSQPRFRLLNTVREYAWEQLVASGDRQEVELRHTSYFVAVAEQAQLDLLAGRQRTCLEQLDREHDNMRAVLRRSGEAGQAEIELRLTGALARFWHMRGHLDEGCEWLAGALERGAGGPVECLARAFSGAAMLQAERGEWTVAQRLSQASLERYQELDDRQGMAVCLAQLARAQHRLGAGATARANGRRSLALARECGDPWCVAHSLLHLAEIAVDRAEFEAARRLYDEGLSLALAIGDHWGAAGILDGLAVVAVAQGRPRGGLRLAGAAQVLRAALGAVRSPLAQAHLDQWLASARAAVGANIAAALQAEAKTQPPDQVARDAFGFEEAHEPSSPVAVAHDAFRRLTRREREVALVVAQGLHNRQIGHVLGVTEHTVEVHVSSVLGKLGLTSRARLAAWLVGHNLTMAEREPQAPWR